MANHFSAKAIKSVSRFKFQEDYIVYDGNLVIKHRLDKEVYYVMFQNIPIQDWDWPNLSHKSQESITVQDFGQVVDLCENWLRTPNGLGQSIRLYETPGGVRGFFLKDYLTPEGFFPGADSLGGDPLYNKLVQRRKLFSARVSPKLDRPGDFVARYVCTLGAEPDKTMLDYLIKHHDLEIEKHLAK